MRRPWPPSLWSGNVRLSLVLIPVRLVPAVSTEDAISFRQIHAASGTPIRNLKGIREGGVVMEVDEEENLNEGISSAGSVDGSQAFRVEFGLDTGGQKEIDRLRNEAR